MRTENESRIERAAFASPARILVATDLTDGEHLVPNVVAQAQVNGAHVTLIHAAQLSAFAIEFSSAPYLDSVERDSDMHAMLMTIAKQIESHGIVCEAVIKHGAPAQVIREEIALSGASRLIMGTHGRGKLGQLVLGSVAKELLGTLDIPVFAIGPHVQDAAEHWAPRKILHPVSMQGDYQQSAAIAIDLANSYGAELTLLHVLEGNRKENFNAARDILWAENALDALVNSHSGGTPVVHTIAMIGDLVKQILAAAIETNTDWIVLGTEEETSPRKAGKSTAYKVIAAAACPVFIIPQQPVPDLTEIREQEYISTIFS